MLRRLCSRKHIVIISVNGGVHMCDKSTLQSVLSAIAEQARLTFAGTLIDIILFGSYARGDYDVESDIDIMLLVDMPAEKLATYRKAIIMLSTDLDLEYDVFTSVMLQDLETFEKWKDSLPFYQKVLSEGVQISA